MKEQHQIDEGTWPIGSGVFAVQLQDHEHAIAIHDPRPILALLQCCRIHPLAALLTMATPLGPVTFDHGHAVSSDSHTCITRLPSCRPQSPLSSTTTCSGMLQLPLIHMRAEDWSVRECRLDSSHSLHPVRMKEPGIGRERARDRNLLFFSRPLPFTHTLPTPHPRLDTHSQRHR